MYFENDGHMARYNALKSDWDNEKNSFLYLATSDDLKSIPLYNVAQGALWALPDELLEQTDYLYSTARNTLKIALNLYSGHNEINLNKVLSGVDGNHKDLYLTAIKIFLGVVR